MSSRCSETVSPEDFVLALQTGMMQLRSGDPNPCVARLDLLEQALPAPKKGNVLDLTYLPGAVTLVRGQGREMMIPGKDFADALLSEWLGSKLGSGALKRELLGG